MIQEDLIRKIIKEEVKKKVANRALAEEFDFLVMETPINELDISGMLGSALGFVGDNFGEAGIDAFKQFIVTKLFTFLEQSGFPLHPESLVGEILINVIEALKWTKMGSYLSDDGCELLTDDIIKGVQEGLLQEPVMNQIMEVFFGPGAKLAGIGGSPLRELINIKLQQMSESLREPIKDFVCNTRDISKLIDDFKSLGTESGSNDSITPDSNEEKPISIFRA